MENWLRGVISTVVSGIRQVQVPHCYSHYTTAVVLYCTVLYGLTHAAVGVRTYVASLFSEAPPKCEETVFISTLNQNVIHTSGHSGIVYCLLSTVYYLLSTVYCPLSTVYCCLLVLLLMELFVYGALPKNWV